MLIGAAMNPRPDLLGPGLGDTQQRLLLALKQRGPSTLQEASADLAFATATVREHMLALEQHRLVERSGTRSNGPGRPEVVYALTAGGEALFPRREGELLRELVEYLIGQGLDTLVHDFYVARIAKRRQDARQRVAGLSAGKRLAEVARIMSEDGYMASVVRQGGRTVLRLAHCPISDVVRVTQVPCRAEEHFIADLLGTALERVEYMPDGCSSCSYATSKTRVGRA